MQKRKNKIGKIELGSLDYRIGRQIIISIGDDDFYIVLDFNKGNVPKSVSWFFEIEISIALDGKISKDPDIGIPMHLWKVEIELETKELDRFIQSPISRKLQIIKDYLSTGLDEFWGKNFG